MPLPDAVAQRVATLVLRLGSNFDGEIVATAAAIVRVLQAGGHDLHDLAAAIARKEASRDELVGATPTVADMVADCLAADTLFKRHELDFLLNASRLIDDGHPLSAKQLKWLYDLHRIAVTRWQREGAAA